MRIGRRTDVVPGGPSPVGVTPRAVLAAARRSADARRHRPSPSKSYAAASTAASYAATSPGGIPNSTVARRASAGTSWRAIGDVRVLVLALRIDDVVGAASGGGRLAVPAERDDARPELLDRDRGQALRPSSPSAMRPASRMVNVVRSAAGTSPSTLSTCSRDATSTRSAERIASSEIWVAR